MAHGSVLRRSGSVACRCARSRAASGRPPRRHLRTGRSGSRRDRLSAATPTVDLSQHEPAAAAVTIARRFHAKRARQEDEIDLTGELGELEGRACRLRPRSLDDVLDQAFAQTIRTDAAADAISPRST